MYNEPKTRSKYIQGDDDNDESGIDVRSLDVCGTLNMIFNKLTNYY